MRRTEPNATTPPNPTPFPGITGTFTENAMNPKPPLRSFSYASASKPKPVPQVKGGPNRAARPAEGAKPAPAVDPEKPATERREPALFDGPIPTTPATAEAAFPLSKDRLDSLFQAPMAAEPTAVKATPASVDVNSGSDAATESTTTSDSPVAEGTKAPRDVAATDSKDLASTTATMEPTKSEPTPAEPAHRPPVLTMHFQVVGTEQTPRAGEAVATQEPKPPAIEGTTAEAPTAIETPTSAKAPAPATKPAKRATPAKTTTVASRPKSAPRLGALDAAAKVLAASAEPLTCPELIDVMTARKLWVSENGKTPAATLHSALMREINTKGAASRFEKVGRGKFARRPMT